MISSGKIDKYEYLTGKEILPSDQRRVIEQAKFTYSPLGKALEKQTNVLEDQGKKQRKACEEHGKQLIKSSGEKDSLELLKEKEIFDELVHERRFEINKSSEVIYFNNLTYYYTGKSAPKYFVCFIVLKVYFLYIVRDPPLPWVIGDCAFFRTFI